MDQADLERLPLHGNSVDSLEFPELNLSTDALLQQPTEDMPSLVLQSEGSDSNTEVDPEEQSKKQGKGRGRGRPLGKRKRSLPAKYSSEQPLPNLAKKKHVTRRTSKKEKTELAELKPGPKPVKRGSRCGTCAGCMREDCGKCIYCLDKVKFGGPAKKKQRCALRTCSNFEHRRKKRLSVEGNGTASSTTLHDYAVKKEPAAENGISESSSTAKFSSTTPDESTSAQSVSSSGPATLASSATSPIKASSSAPLSANPSSSSSPIPSTSEPAKMPAAKTTVKNSNSSAPEKVVSSNVASSTATLSTSEVLSNTASLTVKASSTAEPTKSSISNPASSTATTSATASEPAKSAALTVKTVPKVVRSAAKKDLTSVTLPPTTKTASESGKAPVDDTSANKLSSAKKTLASSQLSYAKVAMQLATTKDLIDKTLKEHASLTEKSSKAVASPGISVAKSSTISVSKASSILRTGTTIVTPTATKMTVKPASAAGSSTPVGVGKGGGAPITRTRLIKSSPASALVNLIVNSGNSLSPSASPKVTKSLSATTISKPNNHGSNSSSPSSESSLTTPTSAAATPPSTSGKAVSTPSKPILRGTVTASLIKSESPVTRVKGSSSTPTLSTAAKNSKESSGAKPSPKPHMVCVQCGRERSNMGLLGSKFCTQRCVITWLEANPDKMPKDAVRTPSTTAPPTKASSPPPPTTTTTTTTTKPSKEKAQDTKPIPRALKNLHIDMAKPGTKLNLSSNSDSSSSSSSSSPDSQAPTTSEVLVPVIGGGGSGGGGKTIRPSIIESLASIISMQQQGNVLNPVTTITKVPNTKVVSVVKPTAAAPKVDTAKSGDEKDGSTSKVSAGQIEKALASGRTGKGAVKRPSSSSSSSSTPLAAPASKKQKMAAAKSASKSSEKSVSFNLNPSLSAVESVAPVALDRIASYFQPKKSETTRIKIPAGLPLDIRQWSVAQVVQYFKSTSDCAGYVDLFESQEVDGIALLLLSHEALVKCLGIKLGRAVKIMNRVQELKLYHEHHQANK